MKDGLEQLTEWFPWPARSDLSDEPREAVRQHYAH